MDAGCGGEGSPIVPRSKMHVLDEIQHLVGEARDLKKYPEEKKGGEQTTRNADELEVGSGGCGRRRWF